MPGNAGRSRAGPGKREVYSRGIYSRTNRRDGITYWFIRYSLPDGRRKKEKAGTNKQDARDLLTNRKAQILNGTYVDPDEAKAQEGPTFEAFAERFLKDYTGRKGSDHYPGIIRLLKGYFGDKLLRQITRADIDRFAVDRARGGSKLPGEKKARRAAGPSTVRKNLIAIGTMFKMALRWGVLDSNPAADLVKPADPKARTRYLTIDEWKRLDAVAPLWLRPMLRIAVATGMRLGEVVTLRWDHVDRQTGLLHVAGDTKTGTRPIPINGTVREVLGGQVRHVRSVYVFLDPSGQPYVSKEARLRITRATIAVMGAASILDATFHTLRHTAASFMVQAGVDLYEVQRILGHSSPTMTQRYAHLQPDHLRRGVDALDAVLQGRTGPVSAPTRKATSRRRARLSATHSSDVTSTPRARSSGDRATAF